MTCYPKEKKGSLSELSRSDPRIRTPPNRSTNDVRHDVIQGRRLIIGIDRVLDQRYPESINHYPRSNGILYISYPTLYYSVGIIDVDRDVRVELSNQGSWRRMTNIQ